MELDDMISSLLTDHGYSQGTLAEAVRARGVKCSQPTIGRLIRGTTDTSYRVVDAIREIYREKCKKTAA